MSRRVVDRKWENRNVYLDKGDLLLLLEEPTKPLITARTRHGRNIKVPLSILSRDNIEFQCQLCSSGPFPDYATYTAHLIEEHFREQLMTGLDFSSGKSGMPRCPFPVCNGTAWASLQALLMHYASHHHVLEKLMMYESELRCMKYRTHEENMEDQIAHLKKKVSKLEDLLEDEQEINAKYEKGAQEVRDIEVITGVGSNIQVKEEEGKSDIKKLIKFEVGTVTSIENQTLKKEYLQIKKEKEKIEKMLEIKTEDLEKMTKTSKIKIQELEKDLKDANENAKNWKDTCLGEEDRFNKDLSILKVQMSEDKKEIENLKNIIEIGKFTVENAKQLSTELAKDNKIHQSNADNYRNEIILVQQNNKTLETKYGEAQQEMAGLRDLVQYLSDKLETTSKGNQDIDKNMTDLKEKYKNLLEVLKRKDEDIDSLRTSLTNFNQEKDCMNTTLEEHMRSWQAEKKAMQTEFRKELEKNSARLRDQAEIIKQKHEEVSVVRLKMEEAKKEARKLSVQVMELKERVKELESCIKKNQTETEQSRLDMETRLQEISEGLESGRIRNNALKKENSLLKENEERLRFEVDVAKAERSDQESRFADLGVKLNAKSRSEDDLKKRLDKMSAELRVQGWEIENYKSRLINSEIFISSLGEENDSKMMAAGFPSTSHNNQEKFSQLMGSSSGASNFIIPRQKDFQITSIYSCGLAGAAGLEPGAAPTPDPSITSQEEYCEGDNNQGSEMLLGPDEVKKEVTSSPDEEDETSQHRNWDLKRRGSLDSISKSNKKMKN